MSDLTRSLVCVSFEKGLTDDRDHSQDCVLKENLGTKWSQLGPNLVAGLLFALINTSR